uniref:Uncharacterized protein n=1 Tax=Oryza sativa subsp. japonica TaxID=39947 RepID=Q2QWW2_ORYSJ|nr:hypothetical protein LOC_Os12g08020 [Oryza sativa Japonica Group]
MVDQLRKLPAFLQDCLLGSGQVVFREMKDLTDDQLLVGIKLRVDKPMEKGRLTHGLSRML